MTTDPTDVRVVPYWEYPKQPRAEQIVQASHADALWAIGEPIFVVMLWRAVDFEKGLVDHCSECWVGNRHADAWQSPEKRECLSCFGTGFEGGYRAKIIRPAIVSDRVSDEQYQARGEVKTDDVTFETTTDFHLRNGDWIIRTDNTRYETSEMNEVVIRSGFGAPLRESSVSGVVQHARLLPEFDIAYKVPPVASSQVLAILGSALGHVPPPSLSDYEVVRGPLIPDAA